VEVPVVFAVRVMTEPETEAVTDALESALMTEPRADAIPELELLLPYEVESVWLFTVIETYPVSYTVV
jgi:hypothetical protein